jgi:MoxR-like ATPase
MRIELGYPDHAAERELLGGADRREVLAGLLPCLSASELLDHQEAVRKVHTSDSLIDYVQALVAHTRQSPQWRNGLSPRAALALLAAARAWAWLADRDHVLPEDVQAVLPGIAGHRLRPADDSRSRSAADVAEQLIEAVPIP